MENSDVDGGRVEVEKKDITKDIRYQPIRDFLAWATSRDDVLYFSSKHDAGMALDALNKFFERWPSAFDEKTNILKKRLVEMAEKIIFVGRAIWSVEEEAPPPIFTIALCGSSRFVAEMAVLAWELEKQGAIVHSLHLLPYWYTQATDHLAEVQGIAEEMDALHLQKIELSDLVVVYNPLGYLGDSTRKEIGHCKVIGIPLIFSEDL